jgi:hypothetical protein
MTVVINSCSSEIKSSIDDHSQKILPIYYKKSISSYQALNQDQIDKDCNFLKKQQKDQVDNFQILGSWFGECNSTWLNLMITSVENNMVAGFIIEDTVFKTFKGWHSTSDGINFNLGITDQGNGDMNYFELKISLENMVLNGFRSKVTSSLESDLPNTLINLRKRNFDYNVTTGLYPEFSQRNIEKSELGELTKKDLGFICEEILARHGLIFFNENTSKYFSNTNWYIPRNFKVDNLLTDVEKSNLDKIYKLF